MFYTAKAAAVHFMMPPDSPKGHGRHHSLWDGFAEN